MTKRERVISALNHIETDIVPYNADFTEQAWENIQNFTHNPNLLEDYGTHLHYGQYWNYPTELPDRPNFFLDGFGVVWNRSGADKDIGVVDHPLIDDADMSLYPNPILDEKRIRAEIENLIATKGDRFCFYGIGFSMFERLWSYCGMENALVFMLTDPELIQELLDKICEHNLKVIDIINEYDLDAVYFGDDWGQQKGLIMGAPLWRKFIKPQMAKMYARAKLNGKFILQHSCGDCSEIFPDLIEIGLDCYQTFQPEVYDIQKMKDEYGDKLAFWGGLSTQQVLPYVKPEEVKAEALRIKNILGKNGGYIWAPTHALAFDIPNENIVAMLEVFISQR